MPQMMRLLGFLDNINEQYRKNAGGSHMNEFSSKQYSKDEVDRIIFRCKKIRSAKIALPYPSPEKPEPNRSGTKKVQIF